MTNSISVTLIANRLAQPAEPWQKFDRAQSPLLWGAVPAVQAHEKTGLPAMPHFTPQEEARIREALPYLGLRAA